MGWDVSTRGTHQLDVSGLEVLAQDLSQRLQANVVYGVFDKFYFDWDGFWREPSYEYWIFGRVEFSGAKKTLMLCDEFYAYHIVYSKYGELAYELPVFRDYDRQQLKDSIGSVCYELRDKDSGEDYATIYNDVFDDWYDHYGPRWFCFCACFTSQQYGGLYEWDEVYNTSMYEFRKNVRDFYKKIGGTEVYYLADQGRLQHLACEYYNMDDLRREIKEYMEEGLLNVSSFMKKKELLSSDEGVLGFFDDFDDLI